MRGAAGAREHKLQSPFKTMNMKAASLAVRMRTHGSGLSGVHVYNVYGATGRRQVGLPPPPMHHAHAHPLKTRPPAYRPCPTTAPCRWVDGEGRGQVGTYYVTSYTMAERDLVQSSWALGAGVVEGRVPEVPAGAPTAQRTVLCFSRRAAEPRARACPLLDLDPAGRTESGSGRRRRLQQQGKVSKQTPALHRYV